MTGPTETTPRQAAAQPLRTLLLATDGSEDAALARTAATDLAQRTGADLHVVTVWSYPVLPYGYPGYAFSPDYVRDYQDPAVALLQREVERIEDAGGKVAGTHVGEGRPADEILFFADRVDAQLVLMGSRGLGPVHRLVTGSVSEEVVHRSSRPVLVMRERESWPPRRIVVGEDGSAEAHAAAVLAAQLASALGATLVAVEVTPPLPEWVVAAPGMSVETALNAIRSQLEDRAADLPVPATRLEKRIVVDDPANGILSAVGGEAAALIAVGSRGKGMFTRLRLGSVSTKMLRAADVPVLISPPSDR